MTISQVILNPKDVPLRKGPPTRDELVAHYPANFTWTQLKTFVNSGYLHALVIPTVLTHAALLVTSGSSKETGNFKYAISTGHQESRLNTGLLVRQANELAAAWGKPDTLSLLTSSLDEGDSQPQSTASPDVVPKYFTRNPPREYVSIIQNDWPYSIPPEIEHTLIWTSLPIYHEDLVHESISARVKQDGLWGFTGDTSPPPSPSTLPQCLPALADWGITMDTLIRSNQPTPEEAELLRRAGEEIHEFIRNRWNESNWETAWFVNPPLALFYTYIV
ncbi:hypothetical protein H0H93_014610 [Arthromyces matolae]|nr:hypothetical protein H0H93_014610 [Arthromyces matolae]